LSGGRRRGALPRRLSTMNQRRERPKSLRQRAQPSSTPLINSCYEREREIRADRSRNTDRQREREGCQHHKISCNQSRKLHPKTTRKTNDWRCNPSHFALKQTPAARLESGQGRGGGERGIHGWSLNPTDLK